MEQRSEEWYEARRGMITASCFGDIMSNGRGGMSKTAESLLHTLLAEHLTGQPRENISSKALDWGTEHEDDAVAEYELLTGNLVESEGFLLHPLEEMVGSSPDGLVGDDGLIEVKCPHNSRVHVKNLVSREIPSEYYWQVVGNIWVTGRDWCDFISYDPRMPEHRLVIVRYERDEKDIDKLASRVAAFRTKLKELIATYGSVE